MSRLVFALMITLCVFSLHAGELNTGNIDFITGSATTDSASNVYNIIDKDIDTVWELGADALSGWAEINFAEVLRITGVDLYGSSTCDQQVYVELFSGSGWISYSGYAQGMVPGQRYYFDFTDYFLVCNKARIRVEGVVLDNFHISEVTLYGHSAEGIGAKAEVKEITASDNTDLFHFADALIDGNISTEWKISDNSDLSTEENTIHNILENCYEDRLFPAPNSYTGKILFTLYETRSISYINIYTTDNLNGNITIYLKPESGWVYAGTISQDVEPGWHQINIDPAISESPVVKLYITGSSGNVEGISEVEIWTPDFKSDYTQISSTRDISGSDKTSYFFYNDPDVQIKDSLLEIDIAGYSENILGIELNEYTKTNTEVKDINGIKRFVYTISLQELWLEDNIVSIPGLGENVSIMGTRLVKQYNYIDEYEILDTQSQENNIFLNGYEYIHTVLIEAGADVFLKAEIDGIYVDIYGEDTGRGLMVYRINAVLDEIIIVNPSCDTIGTIIAHKSTLNKDSERSKIIYPDTSGIVPREVAQSQTEYLICSLSEEVESVFYQEYQCGVKGTVFWIPMTEPGLNNGGYNILSFEITRFDMSVYNIEISLFIEWDVPFSIQPYDEIIYTSDATQYFLGHMPDRTFYPMVWNNNIAVQDITITSDGYHFTCDVYLEEGYNGITFLLYAEDGTPVKLIKKRVFKYTPKNGLTILSPEDGSILNTTTVIVQGKIDPANDLSVLVNGSTADIKGDLFQSGPVLLYEGTHQIIVESVISGTRINMKTITVTVDTTLPVITINSPEPGAMYNTPGLLFSGQIEDASRIWLSVNNTPVPVSEGIVNSELHPGEGVHDFTVQAADAAGNVSEVLLQDIMVDVTPPFPFMLHISPEGWTNRNGEVEVSFETDDALSGIDRYEMSINGGDPVVFTSPLPLLSDDEHDIVVWAYDKAQNVSSAEGKVYIDTTPPDPPAAFRAISGNNSILLRWEKTSDDIVKYILIRLPEWDDGVLYKEIVNDDYSVEYVDNENIVNDTAYIYILVSVDHATNTSNGVISDVKVSGIEIIDTVDLGEEEKILVEYGESALVLEQEIFPADIEVKKIVCTEIEKTIGIDNDGDGIIDEYKDSPLVENTAQPIIGPIYNYSLIVEHEGEEKALNHLVFEKDFLGRITYNQDDIPPWANEENLDVYYFDDIWCKWTRVKCSAVDAENNQIAFITNHFSEFTVQPTIVEDLSPEDLRNSGFSPFTTSVDHSGVTISPEGGGAHMAVTEFSLPGKNGFDLVLKREYNSCFARTDSSGLSIAASVGINFFDPGGSLKDLGELIGEITNAGSILTGMGMSALNDLVSRYAKLLKNQGDYAYSMGQGWRLNLPYIRSTNGGVLIRHPNGGFYDITEMDVKEKDDDFFTRSLKLENHTSGDFSVKVEQSRLGDITDLIDLAFDVNNIVDAWNRIDDILDQLTTLDGLESVPVDLNLDIERLNELRTYDIASIAGSATDIAQIVGDLIPDWSVRSAELTLKNGTKYIFGSSGMLEEIISPAGEETITINYRLGMDLIDGFTGWEIDTIVDSMGRVLEFDYVNRPIFLRCKRSYIDHIEIRNDPYNRMVDYSIGFSDGLYLEPGGMSDIIQEILNCTVYDDLVFPISLLSQSVNTANRMSGSSETIEKYYKYLYEPEFLFEFGGTAKLNLASVIGDAITTALIGVPLVSAITGWDNLTLSADVRFDLLFPVKEVNGPGIGRIVLENKNEEVNYGGFSFTDKFLGLIPVSIQGELRHAERPVVDRITTYKDINASVAERVESYDYVFDVTQHKNIYISQATLHNGRLRTEFYYSADEEEGSKLISWSDHVVENMRNRCLIQPVYIVRTYATHVEKYDGNTLLEEEFYNWSNDKTKIISQRTERAQDQFTGVEYDYDSWGNITCTREIVRAGSRENRVTQYMYYFDPESDTQTWDIHSSNPYQGKHNSLDLSVKRYDLMLGKLVRNYLSPGNIPAAYIPGGVTLNQYNDKVTYYNYEEQGRCINESSWSDTETMWVEKDYFYHAEEGYITRVVSDVDHADSVTETHETNIIHNYSDDDYYTITTSMNAATPDGDNAQYISNETGYEMATGLKAWEKDGRGFYTTYIYDGFGRIIKTEKPSDEDSATYDPITGGLDRNNSNPEVNIEYFETKNSEDYYTGFRSVARSDINEQRKTETGYEYNNLGQLIKIKKKNREYSYVDNGEGGKHLSSPGSALEYETTIEYNRYNEVEKITRPFNSQTTRSVLYEYDALGRLRRVTDEDYSYIRDGVKFVLMDYDYYENRLTTTDQLGNVKEEYFDTKGRLLSTRYDCVVSEERNISSDTVETYIFYDGLGNEIVTVDGRGNAAINEYNSLNRLTRTILPEVDADHGFIEKQNDSYIEVSGRIPAIEYEYTLSGFKKKEKSGYIGMNEDAKLVTEYIVDELGRVYSTESEYTEVSQVDDFGGSDISSYDWTTYSWSNTGWDETGVKKSLKSLAYFDENNNQVRAIDPANTALKETGNDYYCTEYEYSARNKVIKESAYVKRSSMDTLLDPGEETVFEYDLSDNTTLMTDPFGFSMHYYYDNLSRLILAVKPKNERETVNPYVWFEYAENNKVRLKEEGPDGAVVHYTYNSKGLVTAEGIRESLDSDNEYTTTYRCDAAGNIAEIEDNEGNILKKHHDRFNREYETEYTDGSQVWTGYDRSGNKTVTREGINDYFERESWVYYDKYNQAMKTVDPEENENNTWYDIFGNARKNEDEKGRISYYDYDELGRVIREENTRGMVYYNGYRMQGNINYIMDPNGTKVVYFYDYKNQCTGEVLGNSGTIQWKAYEYDDLGIVKTVSTSENMETSYNMTQGEYTPDPYGRIFSIDNDINSERDFRLEYTFDSANRITSFMYPDEKGLSFTCNRFGQLTSIPGYIDESPDYNANGLISRMASTSGVTSTYTYDVNNRIHNIEYKSTPEGNSPFKAYNIGYDEYGNIDELNGGEYYYDKLNRLLAAQITGKFEVDVENKENLPKAGTAGQDILGEKAISFTGEGSDILVLDSGAVSIGIGFGDIDREVSRIRLYPDTEIDEAENLGKKNFAVFTAGNNDDLDYTIVPDSDWILQQLENGVLEIRFRKPVNCRYIKVHCFCDERDSDNNPVLNSSIFQNMRSVLIRVYYVVNLRYETYNYDETGNRLASTYQLDGGEGVTKEYRYYENSDLLRWDGTYAYNWDNNGNLIAKGTDPQEDFLSTNDPACFSESEGEYWEYQHDLFNRLVAVKKSESGVTNSTIIAEYLYDAHNMRIKKVKYNDDDTVTALYYCFSNTGILVFNETDTEYSKYIYVNGKLFSKETGSRAENNGEVVYTIDTSYYYHTDHLGNTTAITDSTGRLIWQDDLTPFGESSGHLGIIEENAFYTGKEMDPDTGLYYFNARWYDAAVGRFISEDPIKDGVNWYVYVINNPLVFIDLTGLDITSFDITGKEPGNLYIGPIETPGPFPEPAHKHNWFYDYQQSIEYTYNDYKNNLSNPNVLNKIKRMLRDKYGTLDQDFNPGENYVYSGSTLRDATQWDLSYFDFNLNFLKNKGVTTHKYNIGMDTNIIERLILFSSDSISFDENYLPSLFTNDFGFLNDLQSIQDVEGHESVLMAQDSIYYLPTTEQYISEPGKIKAGKTVVMDFRSTYGRAPFKNWEYEHMDGLLDAIEMGSNLILGGIDAANTSNVFIYTAEKEGTKYWSILAPVPHITLDPGGMQMIVTPRFLTWDQLLQTYPNFALDLAFDKVKENK